MKKIVMLLPIAALMIAGSNATAQDSTKPDSRPSRADVIKQYDKNGDGKIDDSERQAAREAFQTQAPQGRSGEGRGPRGAGMNRENMMAKYDTNKDGELDEKERTAMREDVAKNRGNAPQGRGQGRGFDREAMMKEFDEDGDGKLSDTERQVAMAEMRKRYQAEGRPNRAGGPNGRPQMNREDMVKKYDKDGDGKLDEKERTALRGDMQKNMESRRPKPDSKPAPEPDKK